MAGVITRVRAVQRDSLGVITRVWAVTPVAQRGLVTRVRATATQTSVGRISRVRARTSGQVSVTAGQPQSPSAFETVTLEATQTPVEGPTVQAWTWTQLSGPTVALVGAGRIRTYRAPATLSGATLVFQVSGDGAKATVTHTVRAHGGFWSRSSAGLRGRQIRRPSELDPAVQDITFGTLATNSMSSSATWYPQLRAAGVDAVMDEWRWSTLQPNGPGTALDATAVAARQTKWQQYKDLGFSTLAVGLGLHYEPAWTFAQHPLGSATEDRIRFRGPDGTLGKVDDGDALDGVWSAVVRAWYDDFLTRMAAVIPFSEIDVIRITSGSRSELLFPEQPSGRYWVSAAHVQSGGQYLAAGQTTPPMSGWDPSTWTPAQRRAEVEWYLQSLVNAAVWQMTKCRSLGFTGRFDLVKPGRGVTVTAFESDIATGLPQSNLLSRGVAWHRVADLLPDDPAITLWASSVGQAGPSDTNRIPTDGDFARPLDSSTDSWAAYRWMRYLANRYGYGIGGENPGLGMGAVDPFYSATDSTGLMRRVMDEIAPTGARRADRFAWAHADNLRTASGLLAEYAARITAINQ